MSKVLKRFEDFIENVNLINDEILDKSIGAWSVRDVISHLTNWDRYSLDVMVPLMEDGARLPEWVDHDKHNQIAVKKAAEYVNADSLKQDFRDTRLELVKALMNLNPELRFTIGKGKRTYSIDSYTKIFVHHDEHHMKQIQEIM
ncbi:DinB family protein [Paenibacillus lemnae]|uniref:DinB family protein n=1 Tax=Paenibacillus lemnae TaxID=1330551 RepID=A0A848M5E9_PAELE|nr:DinB family protein [Paenibacillus lemnae]NMO95332.1 DinB family protein [Paenibacillus lemnae]